MVVRGQDTPQRHQRDEVHVHDAAKEVHRRGKNRRKVEVERKGQAADDLEVRDEHLEQLKSALNSLRMSFDKVFQPLLN